MTASSPKRSQAGRLVRGRKRSPRCGRAPFVVGRLDLVAFQEPTEAGPEVLVGVVEQRAPPRVATLARRGRRAGRVSPCDAEVEP